MPSKTNSKSPFKGGRNQASHGQESRGQDSRGSDSRNQAPRGSESRGQDSRGQESRGQRKPAAAQTRQASTESRLRFARGEILYGRHAVMAALANSERENLQLVISDSDEDALSTLPALPKSLTINKAAKRDIDAALRQHGMEGAVHQGIVLITRPLPELDLGDLMRNPATTGPVMLLDQVTDPHNVGAILRSAAVFGACALVTTERNAPDASGVLAKAASGAAEIVPIIRVVNLARALEELGDAGYWRIGLAEGGSRTIAEAASGHEKIALVMGAEGPGLRRLTKERCDELALLPAASGFTTLNVSNAAAVALYAVTQK